MIDPNTFTADLAWPLTLLIAWLAGECGRRWLELPTISVYAVIGFAAAGAQSGLLAQASTPSMLLLANIAFGLILFECGYRINLRWLRCNPWLVATSLLEAALTFCAVYYLARWMDVAATSALILAALSMATSPAAVLRVINEQRSSGQVTERALHLAALNCVLAVFVFKVIVGLVVFQTSGSLWQAGYSSLIVLAASVVLGAFMGLSMPALLRRIQHSGYDSTLAFAIAVIFLVALTHGLKVSPVLATLTFGVISRHRRIVMSASQRGFGALGDLLAVVLFTYIAATLEWRQVLTGFGVGVSIIAVRQVAKSVGIGMLARASGTSWRKGLLTALAMSPMSAFVILVLEQTRYLGIDLADRLAPLAAVALTLEILGPVLTQRALIWSHEVPEREGR